MRFALIGAALAVVVGTAVVVSIVLLGDGDDTGRGGWTIEDARQFEGFSLYWLGDSYEGLPLTEIIRYRHDPETPIPAKEAEDTVIFIYGSCTPPREGGCVPPLSLSMEPCRIKPPGHFSPRMRLGEPFEVRGALVWNIGGDHFRIWTRDVSIAIFTEPASQMDVANQLRLVTEGPEGALKPLGPPDPGC